VSEFALEISAQGVLTQTLKLRLGIGTGLVNRITGQTPCWRHLPLGFGPSSQQLAPLRKQQLFVSL